MLASKSWDTDLHRSEKQTLFRFSVLYILLTIVIISIFSFIYYELQKDLMLQAKKSTLESYSKDLLHNLKQLHINFDKTQLYPRSEKFESAIYDNSEKLIFATSKTNLHAHKILYLEDSMVHLVNIPESYYLGAKYVIVKMKDDLKWYKQTRKEIFSFGFLSFVFMFIVGYMLLRLFLKPMRDALNLLDRFIKDTTHELNTPVSTIVANIEMINQEGLDERLIKKINRIDIAAKTISNIYQDLTFLTLGNKIISNNEDLNIGHLVEERVEYFKSLARAKKVMLYFKVYEETTLYIDKAKFSKLIDNLISNAIKYNKMNGTITLDVYKKEILIKDTGIGIKEENISHMQERYARFNKSSGGFGIGLNIVSGICKEYNLKLNIESSYGEWTKVSVQW